MILLWKLCPEFCLHLFNRRNTMNKVLVVGAKCNFISSTEVYLGVNGSAGAMRDSDDKCLTRIHTTVEPKFHTIFFSRKKQDEIWKYGAHTPNLDCLRDLVTQFWLLSSLLMQAHRAIKRFGDWPEYSSSG
jgi:hypothetical protein